LTVAHADAKDGIQFCTRDEVAPDEARPCERADEFSDYRKSEMTSAETKAAQKPESAGSVTFSLAGGVTARPLGQAALLGVSLSSSRDFAGVKKKL
jgi:hypothetical protein